MEIFCVLLEADPEPENETYLGDAVYASYDGFQVWLRTGDGNDQRIALDGPTYNALANYVEGLREAAKARAAALSAAAQAGKAAPESESST